MFRNYLTITFRALLRQKVYSAVNIFGLTAGVTASLLILLYVADELSYDRFYDQANDIHRIDFHGRMQNNDFVTAQTGLPIAAVVQQEVAGVESVVRVDKWMTCPVRYEAETFTEMNFLLADSNFFAFFGIPMLAGNPDDALQGPNKIVITERAAERYFQYKGNGDRTPLGKTLIIGSEGAITAEVTGIVPNPPHNTHLHYDFIMSFETSGYADNPFWLSSEVYTYVKLHPGTPASNLQHALDAFITKYCAREIQNFMNLSLDEFRKQGGHIGFSTIPLTDIHLYSSREDELEPNGNIDYVYLFSGIAAFIVLLACINFMNLSTARSANRAREIGVRKTIGAMRTRLMLQFILESFVYVIIAFVISIALVYVLLTPFNALSGKELTTSMLLQPEFLTGLLVFLIVVGLMAGSYPAFYLTSFKPAEVLKGRLRSGTRSSGIRNTLVVFQFFVSIALIICSVMVYRQLEFLQNRSVGFDKENVVGLMHTMNLGKSAKAFHDEITAQSDFVAASYSNRLPPNLDWFSTFKVVGKEENFLMSFYQVDYDHLKTLGLEMVEGRYFSPDFPSDSMAVIVNETAIREMNITDWSSARLIWPGDTRPGSGLPIIGVVKDFNYESLKTGIRPLFMMLGPTPNWTISVRFAPGNPQEKLRHLEALWKKYAPTVPFEYAFVDDNIQAKFQAEQRLAQVIVLFTFLAVFIACLGLFGLATFATEQRAKEISVRKIMGASVPDLVLLLSKDFVKLVIVSFVVAVPVAWYGMKLWLEGFAYRIDFSVTVAAVAGITALMIALLTVSFHAVKAALSNPVDALRTD
jgi:putative ABC transport system permease protein